MTTAALNKLPKLTALIGRHPNGEWHYALTTGTHSWICH
jgi:hypothetical protein